MNYEEKFRKMWNWLADNPSKEKINYFKENYISPDEIPEHLCYACEACEVCEDCPVGEAVLGCGMTVGVYSHWCVASNPEDKAYYARKIAELPWTDYGEVEE